MLFIRFTLYFFSLYDFFLVAAAAPLFDQAPVLHDDTAVMQGSSDTAPQPNLRESVSLLKEQFNPSDYCKCTTKNLERLPTFPHPKGRDCITPPCYAYYICLNECPEAQAMDALCGKRNEVLEILVGGTEIDDLLEGGKPPPLRRRFNLPNYSKCTSKYLQFLALDKICSSNPLPDPNIEIRNEHNSSCLNKCPAAQSKAAIGGRRARILGDLISGLADVISGTVGNSHHHKSSKPRTRSPPFLPLSYAVAGQFYTPKLKEPKKPNTKRKPGMLTFKSTPSTPWLPRNREEEALESCNYESKYIGPELASCLGMCYEDPTIRTDSTGPSRGNTKRQGFASNEIPPKSKSPSEGHSPEQDHHEVDESSADTPAVDQGPNPNDYTHIPCPFTINIVKISTCGCESKGYSWADPKKCLTTCFNKQPKVCIMTMPMGGLQKCSPSSYPDSSLIHPIAPPGSVPHAQVGCELNCASNFPHNVNQQYTCTNACYEARGSTCVAILGPVDKNPNVVYIGQKNLKSLTNLKLSGDNATPLGVSLFLHLVETVEDDEQHKAGKDSRVMRRSLPYMNPPHAQPAKVARPGEKGYDEEHSSVVEISAQKDEGLSGGVLLLFFGCSMTPLLVLVWVGRMYRGKKYQRVSKG